eukprot:8656-Pelagomonas_calceolata.AAC.1
MENLSSLEKGYGQWPLNPTETIPCTHCGFMIIEKWALPYFKKPGFQSAIACTAACTDIDCACCQKCNNPGGLEPITPSPPTLTRMFVMSANIFTAGNA